MLFRSFAKRRIEELIDTREPQLLAGIVNDFRVINGQRGKLGLFKLDDKSGEIDARVDEALMNANKALFKEDELVIVMGKIQPDRFSGGVQLTVTQVWSLEQARCRFGKFFDVTLNLKTGADLPAVGKVLKEFPAKRILTDQGEVLQGLAVRFTLLFDDFVAPRKIQIDDKAFFPSDAALASWRAQASAGLADIVYESA